MLVRATQPSSVQARARGRRIGAVVVLFLLLLPIRPLGQDVTEVALKAAFIYNFAKFTDWPADALPNGAPLVACVLGDPAVADALERTVRGRQASGHGIEVLLLRAPEKELKSCHLLYVSGVPASQATDVAAALRTAPVLTISDIETFASNGGVAQFFVENGKMRFTINLGAARRARLQLSSRLLALAVVVESAGPPFDSALPRMTGARP